MTVPYWLEGAAPGHAPLRGDVTCDVLLIGAGVCGAAAALALGKAGVSTVWLEGGTVSGGASGRNAGFILQGTAERYVRAVGLMGRERARAIHQVSVENHRRMRETIAQLGLSCGYQRRGSLQVGNTPEEEAELRASAALLQEDGFRAEILEELPPWCAEAGYHVGVFLPEDGELQPAAFVRGVAEAAVASGVVLHERSPVLELAAPSPGDVYARTPEGSVRASIALVCTNATAGKLLPFFADKVDPVRGQMLATAPAPPLFGCPIYADHGYDYWRQDERGVIVLGGWRNLDPGREVGEEDVLHDLIQERMAAFLRRFSALRDIEITHRWSGTMGFSRDGLPLVGAVPGMPGALAAAGFTGHGFGFAWVCGEALVETVMTGESAVGALLAARRFR